MIKNHLLILFLILITNCAAPGAALFTPAITGVATESLARATLSYTTNKVVNNLGNRNSSKKFNSNKNFHN